MESTPMPAPLRQAIHQLIAEAVQNCQEVLRYTEPAQAHTWKRMALYRATDRAGPSMSPAQPSLTEHFSWF